MSNQLKLPAGAPGAPLVLLALVASSCSSSSGDPPVTNNLTLQEVSVETFEPRIGYEVSVATRIEALEQTEDVSVSYFALNKADIDLGLEEIRQFFLATETFATVDPLTPLYEATFTIPPGIDPPGDYVIRASLDPSELIRETDEDDNFAEVAVLFDPIEAPNVFIESMELDSPVILLDTDYDDVEGDAPEDVQNSDAGATLVIGVEGTLDPVAVELFVSLRITRTDLAAGSNTHDLPLYMWDSEALDYADVYGLLGAPAGLPLGTLLAQAVTETEDAIDFSRTDRKSLHVDVYLPGRLAQEMIAILEDLVTTLGQPPPPDLPQHVITDLRAFFSGATHENVGYEIVCELRALDDGFVDDDPSDNFASDEVALILPGEESSVPTLPLVFEDGAESGWTNENFGIGYEFDALASVDEAGAKAQVLGALPVTILGHDFNFMEFGARAQVVPGIDPTAIPPGENTGFYLNVDFAGLTIYSLDGSLDYSYDGEWSAVRAKSYSSVFFAGPVPITVGATISGAIGFELHANLVFDSLACSAGPFASLDASVTGAVGVPGLQAGVGGGLTIIDERFTGTVTTGLAVREFGPSPAIFEGTGSLNITNTLTGPVGRLFLFAEYPTVKWCNSVFGSFPCGVKLTRSELVLVTWASFVKEDVLFDQSLCKAVTIASGDVTFGNCQ